MQQTRDPSLEVEILVSKKYEMTKSSKIGQQGTELQLLDYGLDFIPNNGLI
jgi:hypothetical protein